jgi:signal transduction histidine kinase
MPAEAPGPGKSIQSDEGLRLEERLEKAQAYHVTLTMLVHDLRGPVARVKAAAELLREEIAAFPASSPQSDTVLEWLSIVNRATDMIDKVLGEILTAARNSAESLRSEADGDLINGCEDAFQSRDRNEELRMG